MLVLLGLSWGPTLTGQLVICRSWWQPLTSHLGPGGVTTTLTSCSLGRAVEEGLTYKFHAAWSSVLQLLCVFFETCGRQAHPVMKKVSWGGGLLDFGLLGISVISAP